MICLLGINFKEMSIDMWTCQKYIHEKGLREMNGEEWRDGLREGIGSERNLHSLFTYTILTEWQNSNLLISIRLPTSIVDGRSFIGSSQVSFFCDKYSLFRTQTFCCAC